MYIHVYTTLYICTLNESIIPRPIVVVLTGLLSLALPSFSFSVCFFCLPDKIFEILSVRERE